MTYDKVSAQTQQMNELEADVADGIAVFSNRQSMRDAHNFFVARCTARKMSEARARIFAEHLQRAIQVFILTGGKTRVG